MPKFVPKKVVVTFTPNTLYENILSLHPHYHLANF